MGLGRGSNKASRANLQRGAKREWFIYGRGSGIGWTQLYGPMFGRRAVKWAAALEAFNHTATKPLYVAAKDIYAEKGGAK